MSNWHCYVALEPSPPGLGEANPGSASSKRPRRNYSFAGTNRPEKTMMDCKKLRELLDAYVDRELSPDAAGQAEAHIAECQACRRAMESLSRLREAVRTVAGKPEAPAYLWHRVQNSLSPKWHRTLAIQAI